MINTTRDIEKSLFSIWRFSSIYLIGFFILLKALAYNQSIKTNCFVFLVKNYLKKVFQAL